MPASRFDILVTYDVNTEDAKGRRRLRHVATACKDYGQRVQLSVFECRVSQAQYETLRDRLLKIINPKQDSLRLYKLANPREDHVECYGLDAYTDFDDPLII
jgi:CRISPR-associated protein Cas2